VNCLGAPRRDMWAVWLAKASTDVPTQPVFSFWFNGLAVFARSFPKLRVAGSSPVSRSKFLAPLLISSGRCRLLAVRFASRPLGWRIF
jgi:hypothetical protein